MKHPLVAQICLFPGTGGAEHYLLNLAEGLADTWPLVVVTVEDSWLETQARQAGFEVAVLPDPVGNFSLVTVTRLARILRARGVRIAHSHLGRSDWYTWLAAKLVKDVVLVSTEHGISADRPDLFVGTRGKQAIHQFGHRMRMADMDAVVAISAYTARALRSRYGGGASLPLVVVRSGIDLSRFPHRGAADRRGADAPLRLVYVGRMEPEKGPDLLLQAVRRCADDGLSLALTMVGDGSLRASLEHEWQIHPRVEIRWAGHVGDPRPFLLDADVFVLPSRSENLPLAILEAMAAGLPVVAAGVGGIPEIVSDGWSGLLVTPEDSAALAAAIQWCSANRAGLAQMGRNGKRLAAGFGMPRMAASMSTLYEELLRARAARAGAVA